MGGPESALEATTNALAGAATYQYSYRTWSGESLYLQDLYVAAAHRGEGVGTQLIRGLAAVAVASDCDRMFWESHVGNARANKFYGSTVGAETAAGEHQLLTWKLVGVDRLMRCASVAVSVVSSAASRASSATHVRRRPGQSRSTTAESSSSEMAQSRASTKRSTMSRSSACVGAPSGQGPPLPAAFRKSAAAYDERVALQARRAFYARIPSLGAGPVDAAIALGLDAGTKPFGSDRGLVSVAAAGSATSSGALRHWAERKSEPSFKASKALLQSSCAERRFRPAERKRSSALIVCIS